MYRTHEGSRSPSDYNVLNEADSPDFRPYLKRQDSNNGGTHTGGNITPHKFHSVEHL